MCVQQQQKKPIKVPEMTISVLGAMGSFAGVARIIAAGVPLFWP